MDLVTLPQGLFVFYGALVLSCGIGLGIVFARNWAWLRGQDNPPPNDLLQRRVALLEEDLDLTDAAVQQLVNEREREPEPRPPRARVAAA